MIFSALSYSENNKPPSMIASIFKSNVLLFERRTYEELAERYVTVTAYTRSGSRSWSSD
jgi:hypothetical protein